MLLPGRQKSVPFALAERQKAVPFALAERQKAVPFALAERQKAVPCALHGLEIVTIEPRDCGGTAQYADCIGAEAALVWS
jgi:hypothetical protein